MRTTFDLKGNSFFSNLFLHSFFSTAKKQIVLSIATVAMIITCFFIHPSYKYLSYFDYKTLACLFSTLAVVGAFKNIHMFEIIGQKIVTRFNNLRYAVIAVTFVTFFASMLLANDMALLTFLPLSYYVLKSTGKEKVMAFTFIMQNIAANLGGMITPFGNPQNLYLYSFFNISNPDFFGIMAKPFIISTILIVAICFFIKKEPLVLQDKSEYKIDKTRAIIFSILFVIAILTVFRIVPFMISTGLVLVVLLFMDRKALKEVNYALLLTFCVFFVFAGNMAKIDAVQNFLGFLIQKNTLLFGLLSCQCISNVPSAILLSKFTTNYSDLLVAVNIGGLGTLIASLASLITYSEYVKHNPNKKGHYIRCFSLINFSFLIILYIVQIL